MWKNVFQKEPASTKMLAFSFVLQLKDDPEGAKNKSRSE